MRSPFVSANRLHVREKRRGGQNDVESGAEERGGLVIARAERIRVLDRWNPAATLNRSVFLPVAGTLM
ncbi:MAG: hypothetical protein ACOYEF_13450 [Planifilum sp.]|jgi:hypothetical protein